MGVNKSGSNFTYKVGNQSWSQNNLNNNMRGTDANAIYYATHGGSMGGTATPGMVTETPVYRDTNDGGRKPTGGGTATSSASIGGGSAGFDYNAQINAMLEQQRAAARAAYEEAAGRLNAAWDATQAGLRDNYNSALEGLRRNYEYGQGVANDDAAKSLRQAYVNYMMNKRNMDQNLAAAGVSGGATESSLAKMYNNYGNSRNSINTTLAENLAELLNNYQNNVSSADQLYRSQWMDANNNYVNNMNQLENALMNNMIGTYSGGSLSSLANYASTLANLQNQMQAQAEAYTPTENTLAVNNVSTTQGNNTGSVTDYAKYLAMVNNLASQGATTSNIIQQLRNNGASLDDVYKILGA